MSGVNKVILIGNLGKDPEVRNLESGAKVANFSLATTENYKDRNGNKVERTEWHNIVLWRGLADIAERYLRKGSKVYIEGRIRSRSYDDKDGNKRYVTEIEGQNMTMLGSRQEDIGGADSYTAAPQVNDSTPASTDNIDAPDSDATNDLPF